MLNINGRNLCEHCFAEIRSDNGKCSFCSYPKNNEKYPTALTEGTILAGRYVVGRVLGKGGFGVTYLCYDSKDRTRVAIKEYLPDSLTHRNTGETSVATYGGESEEYFKTGAQKFYDEAKLVSRFNGNPNIISVYEFFYENNTTYFVMEYLEGTDLKHYIKENGGKISEEEVLYIALKITEALMIVHSTDVLHRDISPDNIFLCGDGKVKLIDFGAARQVIGEASKSLSVILKQGFAPLEQYQKRGKQGPWTDIYALGASLYYALTGEILDDAMSRITDDNVSFEGISPDFALVLEKMLAVRKEDRYQNTFELKEKLAALHITPKAVEIKVAEKPVEPEAVTEELDDIKVTVVVKAGDDTEIKTKQKIDIKEKVEKLKSKINFDIKNKKSLISIAGGIAAVLIVLIVVAIAIPDKNDEIDVDSGSYSKGNEQSSVISLSGIASLIEETTADVTKVIKTTVAETTKAVVTETTKAPVTKENKTTKKAASALSFNNRYNTIAAGALHTVGIKSNATVVAVGNNKNSECDVSNWKNIVSVAVGNWHTVGLKTDGTVVTAGDNTYGQRDVSGWKKIVAVDAAKTHTVGLKSDGTVVATGSNEYGQCDVSGWKNIVAVAAGDTHTVGLKSDGTVVATGQNCCGQCDVSGWKNITAISATHHTVGLKSDGTVVAKGHNDDGRCNVSGWKNIVAVAAGECFTIGLKSDGTVVAVGHNCNGQCDVSDWKNITAIAAGKHTIGLKSNGTVVAAGSNDYGQCNVSDWKKMKLIK